MIRAIGAVLVALGGFALIVYGGVWMVLSGRGELDWDVPYLPVDEPLPAKLPCSLCRGTGHEIRTVHRDYGDRISMGGSVSMDGWISRPCPNGCPSGFTTYNSGPVAARRNHR